MSYSGLHDASDEMSMAAAIAVTMSFFMIVLQNYFIYLY